MILEILKEIREDNKEICKDISKIQITQAEQAIILEEHQKASSTNSIRLTKLEDDIVPEIINKLTPKSRDWKKIISWAVGVGVGITAIIGGLVKSGLFLV